MMKARKFGTIAALGGSTAALAMLTGLAGARADDLQVNQQLLDTRIDQLAAVGLQPGAGAVFSVDQNAAAGAAAVAGSFPRSILIPGTDTSVKFYGQITEVLDYYMTGGNPDQGTVWNTTVGDNGQVQAIPVPINPGGINAFTPAAASILGSTQPPAIGTNPGGYAPSGTAQTANLTAQARSNGIFGQSPRESKFGIETRTPTPFGEARTVFEFDWAGSTSFAPGGTDPQSVSDNILPRLRYAYGTLGGLLAGQATSNFSDPDANAETLDFGGNVGEPGHVRIPQVRYTMPAWWGASLSASAELPETIIATPVGVEASDGGVVPTLTTSCATLAPAGPAGSGGAPSATSVGTVTCSTTLLTAGSTPTDVAKTSAPDFTLAYYIPQPWGHLDLSAVVRPGLDVDDGRFFARDYIGYGGHIGLDYKPGWFGWVKDDFTVHFEGGDAVGPYVNSSTNFDLATNYGLPGTSNTAPAGALSNAQVGTYGGFNGPTTAASASEIIFKPTQEIGAEVGYQHWWLDNLRSNINAGFNAHYGIPIALVGPTQASAINKEIITGHANLIWNPVSSVDLGLEYVWGQRTVLNNGHAVMNVLISKLAFRF
jgi:porin-like protein